MLKRYWRKFWRVGLGSVLILAGLAMLVLPGPGIVTIILGLALMADEVDLAKRIMEWLKARAKLAEEKLLRRDDNNTPDESDRPEKELN